MMSIGATMEIGPSQGVATLGIHGGPPVGNMSTDNFPVVVPPAPGLVTTSDALLQEFVEAEVVQHLDLVKAYCAARGSQGHYCGPITFSLESVENYLGQVGI